MNNDELKKKILEVLKPVIRAGNISCNEENACKKCWFPCEIERTAGRLADALIAAGIGDVSEYKEKLKLHRVFVRKEGGDIKVLYGNKEVDEIVRERDEYKHRAEVAEKALRVLARKFIIFAFPNGDWEELIEQLISEVKEQAEKELAEERKDENY